LSLWATGLLVLEIASVEKDVRYKRFFDFENPIQILILKDFVKITSYWK